MTELLDRRPPPLPVRERTAPDERPARVAMRDQIERLERRLAGLVCDAFPMGVAADPLCEAAGSAGCARSLVTRGRAGARLLTFEELERRRDALSIRISDIQAELDVRGAQQELARGRLEEIMLDPAAHPWERVTHADIGEPGCRQYHSRARFGILGMMLDWWRVRISSGCPLCMAR